MFEVIFDPASMTMMLALEAFPALMAVEVQGAELAIGALIAEQTHENALARFQQNSPGGLGESFVTEAVGADSVQVGTDKPYGPRLNWGFGPGGSAATDSLGRTYHNMPTFFFSDAITEVADSSEAMAILQAAALAALGQVGI